MAQCTSPFASSKPIQKDLDLVAHKAGNNWRSLLTNLGIELADIESFKDGRETKDACFKGLIHWLKGNVPDEPVTFGTLFQALKDSAMAGCISLLEEKLEARSRLNRADQDLSTQTNSVAANSENQEAIKRLQVKLVKLEKELQHSKPTEHMKASSEAIKQVQKELEELKFEKQSDHMKAKEQAQTSSELEEAIKRMQKELKELNANKESEHMETKEQVAANSENQEAIKKLQMKLMKLEKELQDSKTKERVKANSENEEDIKRLQKEVKELKAEKESERMKAKAQPEHTKYLESQIQSLLKQQQQLQCDLDNVRLRSNPSPMQPIPADNPRAKPTSSSGQFLAMGYHATRGYDRGTKYTAAIDIGTTYTKVAFGADQKPRISFYNIYVKDDWGCARTVNQRKVPTSVLFDKYDKVIAYGNEAEACVMEKDDECHALFRHFKMSLHTQNMASKSKFVHDMTLTSFDGRIKKTAIEVVSKALEYLGLLVIDYIELRTGQQPKKDDITWVITVPAIWNFSLRQFMRKAVRKADLCRADYSNLVIALEPECAALYLEHWYEEMKDGRYAIVDCGGGTVNVSYHQCRPDGQNSYTIDELKESTGEPKGGTLADRKFEALMDEVFGYETIEKLKREDLGGYLDLMKNFEEIKPGINNGAAKNIKCFNNELKPARIVPGVTHKRKVIKIEDHKLNSLFEEPVKWIRDHLAESLRKPNVKSIDRLYLTGGFSLCKLLQDQVTRMCLASDLEVILRNRVKNLGPPVITPDEEYLEVVKGAIIYANNPGIKWNKVMGMSYGIGTANKYDSAKHNGRGATVVYNNGVMFCENVFDPLMRKGDTITYGYYERVHTYYFNRNQNTATFSIYASPDRNVQYTDDPGCEEIGSMTLQMPDTEGSGGKMVKLCMYTFLGRNDLRIRAYSEVDNTSVDCFVGL